MTTINMHMNFEIEIPKQTWLTSWKPCHLQSPETEKSNMAARRPFWKWRCWKSIGSYPYTLVLCRWSLKLIFKAKVKFESKNQKIQYGHQAAILKVTSLKINRLLPMATINMHMKFETEIPKQTWLMLRKPCRRRTDGQTDRRTDKVNPVYPPSNFVGRGYNNMEPKVGHNNACRYPSTQIEYKGILLPRVCSLFNYYGLWNTKFKNGLLLMILKTFSLFRHYYSKHPNVKAYLLTCYNLNPSIEK